MEPGRLVFSPHSALVHTQRSLRNSHEKWLHFPQAQSLHSASRHGLSFPCDDRTSNLVPSIEIIYDNLRGMRYDLSMLVLTTLRSSCHKSHRKHIVVNFVFSGYTNLSIVLVLFVCFLLTA